MEEEKEAWCEKDCFRRKSYTGPETHRKSKGVGKFLLPYPLETTEAEIAQTKVARKRFRCNGRSLTDN